MGKWGWGVGGLLGTEGGRVLEPRSQGIPLDSLTHILASLSPLLLREHQRLGLRARMIFSAPRLPRIEMSLNTTALAFGSEDTEIDIQGFLSRRN